jgi:hypothetical protein
LIKTEFIGLDEFKDRINSAKKEIQEEIDAELQASCMEFVGLAKRDLNNYGGYKGVLKQSVQYEKLDNMLYRVFTPVFYAAFIEFGTKSKFKSQPGFDDVASKFKGQTSSGAVKLIDAIREWVRIKGIATGKEIDRVAYVISRSIYKFGISPQPFFFKHVVPVRESLINRVKIILNGI